MNSNPTNEQIRTGRKCYRPRVPEAVQCVSCPFRDGNHKQFAVIASRLHRANGENGKVAKAIVEQGRQSIKDECAIRGDFMCHCTVYDADMKLKPEHEHRQCPGATAWYKAHPK